MARLLRAAAAALLATVLTLPAGLAFAENGPPPPKPPEASVEDGAGSTEGGATILTTVDPSGKGGSKLNALRFNSDDTRIRYAGIQNVVDFNGSDGTDAVLSLAYWYSLNLATGGGHSYNHNEAIPESGKFFLKFQDKHFYSKISRIDVTNDADSSVWATMTKEDADGMEWSAPINKVSYIGSIGTEFETHLHVHLEEGLELKDVPSPDIGFRVQSYYVRFDGTITPSTLGNAVISNKKPAGMPSEISDQVSRWYHNGLSTTVVYDQASNTIFHTFTFKPTENYLQSGYNWAPVFYDQLDPEIVPYIEKASIYNSDRQGAPTGSGSAKAFALSWDETGLVTSKQNRDISWLAPDSGDFSASRFREVRNNVDDVFWGVLGQSRSYTMAYKLKDEAVSDISEAMVRNLDRALPAGQHYDMRSWVECDLVDKWVFGVVGRSDGGAPPKLIEHSYVHNFLNIDDTDKDGLIDFYEQKLGTNPLNNDSDGDGAPDGVEAIIDKTEPGNPGSWTPGEPQTELTAIRAGQPDLSGTVKKPEHDDSLKPGKKLRIESDDVGPLKVYLVEAGAIGTDPESGKPKLDPEAAERSGQILGLGQLASKAEIEAGAFTVKLTAAAKDGVEYRLVALTPHGEVTVGSRLVGSATPLEKTASPVFSPVLAGDAKVSLSGPTGASVKLRLPSGAEVSALEDKAKPGSYVATLPEGTVLKQGDVLSAVASKEGELASDPATIEVRPAPSDAERFEPVGRSVGAAQGGPAPEAASAVANAADLPEGTRFSWRGAAPSTAEPGSSRHAVVVSYPDGSEDVVAVSVEVSASPSDAERFEPVGRSVGAAQGGPAPEAASAAANAADLPEGTRFSWRGAAPSTAEPGSSRHAVVVSYPDGSEDVVAVSVEVSASPSDAERFEPVGRAESFAGEIPGKAMAQTGDSVLSFVALGMIALIVLSAFALAAYRLRKTE